MAVSILAALGLGGIAAAASFPSGFGFGAGYGSGVRAGYDIIYPRIAPYVQEIIDFLVPNKGKFEIPTDPIIQQDPGETFAGGTQQIPGIIENIIEKPGTPYVKGKTNQPPAIVVDDMEDLKRQRDELIAYIQKMFKKYQQVAASGISKYKKEIHLRNLIRARDNLERFLKNHPDLK